MKAYHSIEKNVQDYIGQHVYAFDKIDGSNFRAEWNKKLSKKGSGFSKFGTRTELIIKTNPFIEAIDIFKFKYEEQLKEIFTSNKLFNGIETITVYGEFYGEHSFTGTHEWNESHDVIIFDMFLYKKDFVKPSDFIEIFNHLGIPKLIFKGLLDEQLIQDIISNKFNLKEGSVIKGVSEGKVFMSKVKTQIWLNKVRALYGINNNIE